MNKSITAILIIVCFAMGCEKKNPFAKSVYSLKIFNNSSRIVTCFYQTNYPDTTLPLNAPTMAGIRPGDFTFVDLDSRRECEDLFATSSSGIVSFFILSADTVNTYSWQTIRNQYKILKRYDIRLHDLDNSNWQIVYQ